ncbi:hypothetical protein [Pseudoclavibacter sp. VKM Ac-2888]|uniref:hypothetical protein n=1 Tax=Pseudoclavibacter sp. VKM Ac-2888 TaxID=2783830 RepID=UPI00188A568E|nr:hypothetical protein [Pseudoclavibacter sp. VKM Ac-2888]MBF4549366.1 hypothetical protein [Pseudoclavibacter sp. VKM Ac-2888]
MLTIAGALAVTVGIVVAGLTLPTVLSQPPASPPVAEPTSTAVEPAPTIRVTDASPSQASSTTSDPAPTSSAARDAVTEQVRLADQLLAQYPAPATDQAMIDELSAARDAAQALLDDSGSSEAKLITANSTLSGHNQAFRVHALTKASAVTADGHVVQTPAPAGAPESAPTPDAAPVNAPSAPTVKRASQSISVSCQAPSAFSITFTASGGGTVELSAAGQSATGAGSASVTAFGQPGQSFSATGSADGSVSVSYSTGGASCS